MDVVRKFKTEIKWGVLFSVMSIVWILFERVMGWHDEKIEQHATMTLLYFFPAVAIYVFGLLEKRKYVEGGFNWKQGFISGLIITAVVVLLSPVAQIIIHYAVAPDFFNNMINYTVTNNLFTEKEAAEYFSLSNYILQSIIGALVMGIFTAAVVAIFTRKKA